MPRLITCIFYSQWVYIFTLEKIYPKIESDEYYADNTYKRYFVLMESIFFNY